MPGLQKYVEWLNRGRRTNRVAYVLTEWDLPVPLLGAEWQQDAKFNAAEEVLANPEMKDIYKAAIRHGVVLIGRAAHQSVRVHCAPYPFASTTVISAGMTG